jgi:2-polyprenyl-3-methyl-5-hydroxy-6-metoxy-1,4-benzoquinol methylase
MATEANPEHIRSLMMGYQKTAALRAAVDLHVFTAIGGGAASVDAIAAQCQASRRGIRILCDYLVIEGLLEKENYLYRLTPDSAALLDERSGQYMGGMLQFLNAPRFWEAAMGLTETVRTGHTNLGDGIAGDEAEEWVAFARHMQPMAAGPSQFIAQLVVEERQPKRVLDIAAGHGLYGIAVAEHAPDAMIVAQDWPKVLAVAQENAQAAGLGKRHESLPGSAFTVELGTGFDLVLITNFLHHFAEATCIGFLRKVRAAMVQGGRVVTLEFIPNDDRVTPARAAAFSLNMLLQTRDGDAYIESELFRMLDAAGFSSHKVVGVPKSPEKVIVSYAT